MKASTFARVVAASKRKPLSRKSPQRAFLNRMIKEIKPLLINENYPKNSVSLPGCGMKVKVFRFEGREFAIKDTLKSPSEGSHPSRMRSAVLAFHKAQAQGHISSEKYAVRIPKALFRYKNFLVMQYLKPFNVNSLSGKRLTSYFEAYEALLSDIGYLRFNGEKIDSPQQMHIWAVGERKGKWIFAFPYDYL